MNVALQTARICLIALTVGLLTQLMAGTARARPSQDTEIAGLELLRQSLVRTPVRTAAPVVPARPTGTGTGKRIVYAIKAQRVWLVGADDKVLRSYLVSGRPTTPRPGSYRVYSRSAVAHSSVSSATMRHMVRFARGPRTGAPIGFHDIPRRYNGTPEQTLAQLGKALSAGCVRQSPADAAFLWRFAPVGTRVVVRA